MSSERVRRGKRGAHQLQVDLHFDSPAPMTRSRSQSLARRSSPCSVSVTLDTNIVCEVVGHVPFVAYHKVMLVNKDWCKQIKLKLVPLGPLRERRWLAAEMKSRRANIGNGLIERLDNSAAQAAAHGKLTFKMHSILVDWLVDVAIEFRLSNSTLALTSSVLDRYLTEREIEKKQLQLLGVTCMWIASKMEEVSVPLVSDFAWITFDTYTVEELRVMERRVLQVLEFSISRWIPMNYINLVFETPAISENEDLMYSISFMHELALHEPQLVLNQPDELAAAICYAAMQVVVPKLHRQMLADETIDFMLHCDNKQQKLQNLISEISKLPAKAIECEQKWQAVLTKYRRPTRNNVACRYFAAPPLPEEL
eukprot:TRINITY_DN24047_c0_g1_i3.p1 TRINITY_DN24047_c0_g1~~TRINITY_DN24047_c0_g1_i3.p1  ORF type:complete len:367 (-),score=57.17 TRINITY_DN24047_c0_g1_i3:310-1410(-)